MKYSKTARDDADTLSQQGNKLRELIGKRLLKETTDVNDYEEIRANEIDELNITPFEDSGDNSEENPSQNTFSGDPSQASSPKTVVVPTTSQNSQHQYFIQGLNNKSPGPSQIPDNLPPTWGTNDPSSRHNISTNESSAMFSLMNLGPPTSAPQFSDAYRLSPSQTNQNPTIPPQNIPSVSFLGNGDNNQYLPPPQPHYVEVPRPSNTHRESIPNNRQHSTDTKGRPSFSNRNIHLNLNYDGARNGLPIERFIFRVERIALSLGIPSVQLVDEIHFLLRGVALEFYWSMLEQFRGQMTWDQLKYILVDRFRERRTDYDIKGAIYERKQKKGEAFMEFYADILTMSVPLKVQLTQTDLLMYLTNNMSPELRFKLAGERFSSVNDLVDRCVSTEDTWTRIRKDPSQNAVNRVHELWSVGIQASNSNDICELAGNIEALQCNRTRNPPNFANVTCWNCYESGHRFTDCKKIPQHVFCYGCGTKNVLKPNCPHCSNQTGNLKGETITTGSPCPPKVNPSTEETASNVDRELFRLQKR